MKLIWYWKNYPSAFMFWGSKERKKEKRKEKKKDYNQKNYIHVTPATLGLGSLTNGLLEVISLP